MFTLVCVSSGGRDSSKKYRFVPELCVAVVDSESNARFVAASGLAGVTSWRTFSSSSSSSDELV